MATKGLDKDFLRYGIRENDLNIIDNICREQNVDPEWMKEYILRVYHEKRNEDEFISTQKEVIKILKQALKILEKQ